MLKEHDFRHDYLSNTMVKLQPPLISVSKLDRPTEYREENINFNNIITVIHLIIPLARFITV